MSDYQAVGGVSATLQSLLKDRMELPSTLSRTNLVTIDAPRLEPPNRGAENPGVNVFLYRVTENPYLKNQEIPGQGNAGSFGRPPLSLDLHYLVTAYGTNTEGPYRNATLAHRLLGSAMRVLHDFPIITEQLATIRTTPAIQILDDSLQGEYEQIKICLDPVSLEDISKIWTALSLPFRPSAAYTVSVVQIESRLRRSYPRPVGEPPAAGPRVYAIPFLSPQISEIRVHRGGDPADQERPYPYARIKPAASQSADSLIIIGRNFAGETTRVMLGGVNATAITPLRDDRIEVTVPDNSALQPGVHPIRVVRDVLMGNPPVPHGGFQSNLASFVLVPAISSITLSGAGTSRRLRVEGTRLYAADLECMTLIGDEEIPLARYLKGSGNPPPFPSPTRVEFNLPTTLGAGNYAVRVRVNGAESIDDTVLTLP